MSYIFSTLEEYERISEQVAAGTRAQSYFYSRPPRHDPPPPEEEEEEAQAPRRPARVERRPKLMPLRTRNHPTSKVLPIRHPPMRR